MVGYRQETNLLLSMSASGRLLLKSQSASNKTHHHCKRLRAPLVMKAQSGRAGQNWACGRKSQRRRAATWYTGSGEADREKAYSEHSLERAWLTSGMEWNGGPMNTGTHPDMTASGRRRLVCESPGSMRQNLLLRYCSICFSCVVCAPPRTPGGQR